MTLSYVNGEWLNSKETIEVLNPATKEVIDTVYTVGEKETLYAIESADKAFKRWKKSTSEERSYFLKRVAYFLREDQENLAKLVTKENGKPLRDARSEIESGIKYIEWYAEETKRIYGDVLPPSHSNKHLMVTKKPIGVCAAITPWNFPFSMITRKIAPALAAGCTVILKPASATPLSAVKVFECFEKANLPKGVVNLVIGSAKKIGDKMTESTKVRKISFTGSTPVGKSLFEKSANTMKAVSMELGGHAPFIIFDDADVNLAVDGLIKAKFSNSGQTCISTNRIYVQENIAKEFTEKFTKKVMELEVGNGLRDEVDVGPIIDESSYKKIVSQIDDAVEKNAEVLCGGKEEKKKSKGYFIHPTVIKKADENMLIANEETFGPVVPIFTFKTDEEVMQKANHPYYGLMGYCYTKDLKKAFRIAEELEYGMIGINDPSTVGMQASFGGLKESGLGKEGRKYGLEEYLVTKYVSFNTDY